MRFDKTATATGSSANLDTISNGGVYSIWSGGSTAEALGLPNSTLGTLISTRYGTGAGMQMWIPRLLSGGSQVWVRSELSQGWSQWSQIGSGSGDNAPPMLRTAPPNVGFKTAPIALTLGYGGAQTTGSGTTSVIQYMPQQAVRARLHLRNRNPRYAMADSPAVTITNVRLRVHTGGGEGNNSITLPNGSTGTEYPWGGMEYQSGWFDVPEAQKGAEIVAQYSWSSAGTIQRNIGTGWENGTRNDTPPVLFAWLEVEVPASTPVVAAFGDSLSSGVSSSRPVVDSWIDQWARAHDAIPAHWSHSGDKASGWSSATVSKWGGLYGWDIAAPDAVIYLMGGSNDLSESTITLTEMQARIADNASLIRSFLTPNVFAGTLLPRTNQPVGSTFETVRRQVNTWLERSGAFREVYPFAAAISDDDETIRSEFDADGIHLNTAGYAALASAIDPSPVGSGGSTTVTYLGDGLYEVA